ncbi:MAG: hypothetical protein E7321_01640 [Clostridiales bacterium]|nr:hypothetical protein [Clostridiales bacterium]
MPGRYDISVDKYVIMPNHIHLILRLDTQKQSVSLCDVVCALKSRTTKLANVLDHQSGRQIWQRSFHDHIIRDEKDYLKIWQYIDENPMRWEQDCFYHEEIRKRSEQDI